MIPYPSEWLPNHRYDDPLPIRMAPQSQVRLLPPSTFPRGVADLLRAGDTAELYWEDGWCDLRAISERSPATSSRLGGWPAGGRL